MDLLLSECNWKLKGVWPYTPFLNNSVETGVDLMLGVTDWIPATVPGGVHKDLMDSGYIDDTYYELNSRNCEWVENRWWVYKTAFTVPEDCTGEKCTLIFKGVDYKAHFYLNGCKLGEHEGMYEVAFDVTGVIRADSGNELSVIIESAPVEMSQIGYTSKTHTQKSRFNYKWDFSTRLVNLGIWDDVVLRITGRHSIGDLHIRSDVAKSRGIIEIDVCVESSVESNGEVMIDISLRGEKIAGYRTCQTFPAGNSSFKHMFEIEHPELWFPNGKGDQPLYKIDIRVLSASGISDSRELYTGIRKLEFVKNVNSPEAALPYTVKINGEKVYVKGVNITPFDHMYGTVSNEKYKAYVELMKNANINLVRIWGGGIIEKEIFYDLCDRAGIMIWQEFIQSSSGLDNLPSTNPEFLKLQDAVAEWAVKVKRNHISLVIWCGGNELRKTDEILMDYNHPNIKRLKDIVDTYDPDRLFLPSSASGPNEFLQMEQVGQGKHHDVHGNWLYLGIKEHYGFYNRSDSLFHSEFGVNGMSCPASLRRFLSPENLKVTNMRDNIVWRHHGEWWDSCEREKEIFGEIGELDKYVRCSQFIQAEGIRYIIEANRRRKFENSGSIVWQLNEPWPNINCTSIIDYYGIPKMAYYWVKKAYENLHVSMAYDTLRYRRGELFKGIIFLNNGGEAFEGRVICEMLDASGAILGYAEYEAKAGENAAVRVAEFIRAVPEVSPEVFFVRLRASVDGVVLSENLYFFSTAEKEIFRPLADLSGENVYLELLEERDEGLVLEAENAGAHAALFLSVEAENTDMGVIYEDNYFSLFPEEKKRLFVRRPENKGKGWHTGIKLSGF